MKVLQPLYGMVDPCSKYMNWRNKDIQLVSTFSLETEVVQRQAFKVAFLGMGLQGAIRVNLNKVAKTILNSVKAAKKGLCSSKTDVAAIFAFWSDLFQKTGGCSKDFLRSIYLRFSITNQRFVFSPLNESMFSLFLKQSWLLLLFPSITSNLQATEILQPRPWPEEING